MNVSLRGITLYVKDVEESKRFYQQIPGAVVVAHNCGCFALIQLGGGHIGIVKSAIEKFQIDCEGAKLDKIFDHLQERGVQLQVSSHELPWRHEFKALDPTGVTIEFSATVGGQQTADADLSHADRAT